MAPPIAAIFGVVNTRSIGAAGDEMRHPAWQEPGGATAGLARLPDPRIVYILNYWTFLTIK